MKNIWENLYKKNNGNNFPHHAVITFYYRYNILKRMKEKYGYGVILNTSFNMHGRTNVLTPENAITDFLDCNLDEMYIGNYKVKRK